MNTSVNKADAAGIIDLRSDTVTQPTAAMYSRMLTSPIGDDGLDGDPTVRQLEEYTAILLGKQAGLYVPSGTMGNLLAVLAQTRRAEQISLESTSHMIMAEKGSATFTGVFYNAIRGVAGAMDLDILADSISSRNQANKTGLIAMETSHNNAGGAVLSLAHMQAVQQLAGIHGIPVHIDGARLFNAAVALALPVKDIASTADTISICLSKGLSAPVGAVLVGAEDTIRQARKLRKMLGGTQRQLGIMAAAGLEAIENMSVRLHEDHLRAQQLSTGLCALTSSITTNSPQTNIVQVDVSKTSMNNHQWVSVLAEHGVLTRPWGASHLRCVTHRHIASRDIELAVERFSIIIKK